MFYLIAAKKAKVQMRIYHSHSAEVLGPHKGLEIKKKIFNILKRFIPKYATNMFACSKAAGEWMYPRNVQNKVQVINNGIIVEKFKFNQIIRNEYRKKMDVEDKVVLGHVARFNHQKNHDFLVKVMKGVVEKKPNYILWLIGNGELEKTIKRQVNELHLEDNIKFMGVRDDVDKLMQAMDIFVLPSNYEGLPVVGIEAQTAGLTTFLSTNITSEVKLIPNCKFIELDTDKWIKEILDYEERCNTTRNTIEFIIKNKYDINSTVEILTSIYLGVEG